MANTSQADWWASQPPAPSTETILRVLRLAEFEYTDSIWWRRDPDGNLRIGVQCNDVFDWGHADVEFITDDDVDSLAAAVAECEAVLGEYGAPSSFLLWVARKRGMRPQGAMYPYLNEALWPLFDAAGPERGIDHGNPKPHPSAKVSS